MTDERDEELDPSDWLASQFGEQPEKPTPARPDAAVPPQPAAPPQTGLPPGYSPPAYVPPAFPPAAAPTFPPAAAPPPAAFPPVFPPASVPPAFPPAAAPPAAPANPFPWGLTPGGAEPERPPAPYQQPPQPTVPPPFTPPPLVPPYTPPAPVPPAAALPPVPPPFPPAAAPPPADTDATVYATLEPTQAIGTNPDPFSFTPSGRVAPLDPAFGGATEVLGAQAVGLPHPEDEGVESSAIDSLFGESSFVDYGDQLIAPLPPRASTALATIARAPQAPRPPIPRTQKILMWVAGALVAALALVALYLVGTKIALAQPAPAVVVSPSPSPSASGAVLALGPVKPGEYNWSELLGGECLDPFDSAWQDSYTVVDCSKPHPAQMVYRGLFPDPSGAVFPGVDELQKRIAAACTAPTVINYAAAGSAQDLQVAASYAADENDWNNGNRTFFCFVNRKAGEPLTASIAVPQTAPATPIPVAGSGQ